MFIYKVNYKKLISKIGFWKQVSEQTKNEVNSMTGCKSKLWKKYVQESSHGDQKKTLLLTKRWMRVILI